MTASHLLMQLGGGALQAPHQVQGRAPEIWHLKVQNTAEKLNFVVQFPSTK